MFPVGPPRKQHQHTFQRKLGACIHTLVLESGPAGWSYLKRPPGDQRNCHFKPRLA